MFFQLVQEVLKILGMSAKLEKIQKSTNHKTKLEDFIAHQMTKHGFLSMWYFVTVLEAGSTYFDEKGKFILLKAMMEMGYVHRKFNCVQFQPDVSKSLGCQIRMTYEEKIRMSYVHGKFNCMQFQSDFSKSLGCQIRMIYGEKKKDTQYPATLEFYLVEILQLNNFWQYYAEAPR